MRALPGQRSRVPAGSTPIVRGGRELDQRRRILLATAELIAERAYQATSVELIIGGARVGYATFYKSFGGKEGEFGALFDVEARRALGPE